MRTAEIKRTTEETDIFLSLNLDGNGVGDIDTGCGFLDHCLTLFAKHSGFNLTVKCKGDTYVDDHHTCEDIAICLGMAFSKAIGDMRGIERYGNTILPMDESLIMAAIDISGRVHLSYKLDIPSLKVGTFDTELTEEFYLGFVRKAGVTLHITKLAGTNSHHIIEGSFKAFARVLKQAVKIDKAHENEIPSTKGVL